MKDAYKAILHGDRVEWLNGAPESRGPLSVSIIIGEQETIDAQDKEGKSVFDLFQELADMGAFSEIEDPVAWQREIRKDRPLPFRYDDAD